MHRVSPRERSTITLPTFRYFEQLARQVQQWDDPSRWMQDFEDRTRLLQGTVRNVLREHAAMLSYSSEMIARENALFTQALVQSATALEASIRPLTDMRPIGLSEIGEIWGSISRVNDAIWEASFMGEVDLSDTVSDSEAAQEELEKETRSLLSQSGADEYLATLDRVDFVPLTLLDRALRDPELMYLLNARDFERFVAGLIEQLGFEDVVLTPRSGDGGRDVLALKKVSGIPILCAFECKRYAPDKPVGPDVARAMLGTISHGETRATKGILVTTSYFTSGARKFILTEPLLDGKDFHGIVDWLEEYAGKRDAGHRF